MQNHRVQKFTADGTFVTKWGSRGRGKRGVLLSQQDRGGRSRERPWCGASTRGVHRVQVFTSTGVYVAKFGEEGDGDGQFWSPEGIGLDGDGNVYVADRSNDRIQKFAPGAATPTPAVTPMPTPTPTQTGSYKPLAIPGRIEAEDYNTGGEGIAYHDTTKGNGGGVYRQDDVDIERFTTEGSPSVGWIRNGEWLTYTTNVTTPGAYTMKARVANPNVPRTAVLSVDGVQTATITVPTTGSCREVYDGLGPGDAVGWDAHPQAHVLGRRPEPQLARVRDGHDHDADAHTDTGGRRGDLHRCANDGTGRQRGEVHRDPGGRQDHPVGLVVVRLPRSTGTPGTPGPSTRRSSTRRREPSVRMWRSPIQTARRRWSTGSTTSRPRRPERPRRRHHRRRRCPASSIASSRSGGVEGSGDGQFGYPAGVAADGLGNVYVVDINHARVQKFRSDGTFILKWGANGSGDGQFHLPSAIAVDSAGNVYVADEFNNRVQKFTSTGAFVTKWGSPGSGDGQFNNTNGIAVDGAGNVYVADTNNHRVQKFTSTGVFVMKWGTEGTGIGQFKAVRCRGRWNGQRLRHRLLQCRGPEVHLDRRFRHEMGNVWIR